MPFYLGMDAGGTRTLAAIADDHSIVARASGGSIKTLRVSPHEAERNLHELLGELSERAALSLHDLQATCLGISGYTLASVTDWARNALRPLISGSLEICGDTVIALDAAFPGAPGVLVIAGTGQNVIGRTSSGQLVGVGGWGPLLGDEGSGHWIGLEALRRSLRAHDRGQPTPLLPVFASIWGIPDSPHTVSQLVNHAYSTQNPQFSTLAPAVFQAAIDGDPLALGVLEDGGRALADDAAAALAKLLAADPETPQNVAFTGSVLRQVEPLRAAFVDELHRRAPAAGVLPEPADPVLGALWRASHAPAPK